MGKGGRVGGEVGREERGGSDGGRRREGGSKGGREGRERGMREGGGGSEG